MDKYVIRTPQKTPCLTGNLGNQENSVPRTTHQSPQTNPGPSRNSLSQQDFVSQRNPGPCDGFDRFNGRIWVYPTNYPIRGYQKQAVEKALYDNAMIVLPTGLGKTFIAAVVMYNYYRWYPLGKLIFVAPTRPLVHQQIKACREISGIPSSDTKELTGSTGKEKRKDIWKSKRVIFATPQVIEHDLEDSILPAKEVRLIVIDEAHRAQGSYAYVGIVRRLHESNRNGFRVLALSATPGTDIPRIQQVMLNLYISDVMFRSESSFDISQFKNQKVSQAWTVELTGKHKELVEKFIKVSDPIIKVLHRSGLTYSADSIDKVAAYTLVRAGQRLRANEVGYTGGQNKSQLFFKLMAATSLAHHFQLLTIYGIRVFYSSIRRALDEPKSKIKPLLIGSIEFDTMMKDIQNMFGDDLEPDMSKRSTADLMQGHPKLKILKDLLMKHFGDKGDKTETRAIVFTKYRESVFDIVQVLKVFEPILKPAPFIGQNKGTNVTAFCMNQKEQIQTINEFKKGTYNVLVATCVAEEGLDIGEVDLIICFDTSSSPISNTQRRGRTGRKRSGNIQTLLTAGYEEKKAQKASYSRRQVEEQLYKRENYMGVRYRDAPRMVPLDVSPACLEQLITPVNDEPDESERPKRKKKQRVQDDDIIDDDDDEDLKKKKKKIDKNDIMSPNFGESDSETEFSESEIY